MASCIALHKLTHFAPSIGALGRFTTCVGMMVYAQLIMTWKYFMAYTASMTFILMASYRNTRQEVLLILSLMRRFILLENKWRGVLGDSVRWRIRVIFGCARTTMGKAFCWATLEGNVDTDYLCWHAADSHWIRGQGKARTGFCARNRLYPAVDFYIALEAAVFVSQRRQINNLFGCCI